MRRIDAGERRQRAEIADARLLWGAPDDVIAQIERYRDLTGCDHVHAAFGAGLPATSSSQAHLGSFETIAEMIAPVRPGGHPGLHRVRASPRLS